MYVDFEIAALFPSPYSRVRKRAKFKTNIHLDSVESFLYDLSSRLFSASFFAFLSKRISKDRFPRWPKQLLFFFYIVFSLIHFYCHFCRQRKLVPRLLFCTPLFHIGKVIFPTFPIDYVSWHWHTIMRHFCVIKIPTGRTIIICSLWRHYFKV